MSQNSKNKRKIVNKESWCIEVKSGSSNSHNQHFKNPETL